jgi:hypothetical protein
MNCSFEAMNEIIYRKFEIAIKGFHDNEKLYKTIKTN